MKAIRAYTINGTKMTISELYAKYIIKNGYSEPFSRDRVRNLIRSRCRDMKRNHKRYDLDKILAK